MNFYDRYMSVLSLLTSIIGEPTHVDSVIRVDLSPLRAGEYRCISQQCGRTDLGTIFIPENPETAYGIVTPESTGFVRNVSRIGETISCDVKWDDGSGNANIEHIRLQLTGETTLILTDSTDRVNAYELVSD